MKISKTRFFNYIRCHRYVALEELTYERDHAVVSFEESMEDLYTQELESKKQELLSSLYDKLDYSEQDFDDDQGFDPLFDDDKLKLIRILQPQYEQIEKLSAQKVESLFGGKIVYSKDTFKQKYIEKEIDGFHFFAFLDAYQEDDHFIRIVETKASTSKKFVDLGYSINKEFFSIFQEDDRGIYHLKQELGLPVDHEKYQKQVKKLLNKYDGAGKYVYDLAYQRYIHESHQTNHKQKEYYLSVLNHKYIYDGKKNLDGSNRYNPLDIIRLIDVTHLTSLLLPIIHDEIHQIIFRCNTMQASPVPLGHHCQTDKGPRECPFINICLKDKGVPDRNSLFVYRNSQNPFVENRKTKNEIKHYLYDLINEGTVHALDINRDWLSKVQKIQYDAIESSSPYSDIKRMRDAIHQLRYPLYHLDFESFASPLPRYQGEKPYQQSLFQFSLHIEYENQPLRKEDNLFYLADNHEDHRELLVKKLIESISMDHGHVIVYNKGFESARIKELIEIFPQYKKELMNIRERIFDLLYMIRGNQDFYESLGYNKDESSHPVYYHEDFQRSYSIKQVLPVFVPDLNYRNLDQVHNGQEAQITYYEMPYMTKEEKDKAYQNMLEYCKQDTWAMVKILHTLKKMI